MFFVALVFRYNEVRRVFYESLGCVVILYGPALQQSWVVQETKTLRQWRAHACTHLLYTSVIISRHCTRVTHYMYHVILRTHTHTHHQADECTGRRDKTQSTRKTRPTRLFTDFYRLPITTNRFGRIPVVPFYLRTDPLVQVTSLSQYDFVHFSSVTNRIRAF